MPETNSLNTPVEALEYAYPFRVRGYGIRTGSGGQGAYRGGDGLIREVELLADAQVTVLSDRRKFPPYGLQGGEPGAPGRALHIIGDRSSHLGSKTTLLVRNGQRIRIETPGGGGWGKASQ